MALVRAVSTIGGFTLLSRIFGFVRDVLVARYLGAGVLSDAFLVAFKLPNFLRRLFAEGAFNAAFVPLFSGTLEEKGQDAAREMAEQIFSVLAWMVLLVVAFAEIFMPWVILAFAPGFSEDPEKFMLTVLLARICFPYILMIALVTLLGGVLNSLNRFAAVAATPILLNICLISALVGLTPYMFTSAHALAIGVMAAGIAQFVWLVIACKRAGVNLTLCWPKLTAPVRKLLRLAAPVALGAGVAQINLMIDVILASLFPGAVSWLYYADRLNELPIGVIGVAVGTALLPMLSKTIRAGNTAEAVEKMNQALVLAMGFAVPATVALLMIPESLVSGIYQHGAFDFEDTQAVVLAMMAYAVGLPAFIMVKVLAPGFYAREDTKTPVKIAMLCVAINIAGNLILMQYYQYVGLAMATSLSGWVNALLMGLVLWRRQHFLPNFSLFMALAGIIVAAALMGWVLYLLPVVDIATLTSRASGLTILIMAGLLTYAVAAVALLYRNRYCFAYGNTSA
jgi:putative peptidoglycan lipid II flippase